MYKNAAKNFDEIETLPKEIRTLLKENCFFYSLKLHSAITSDDGQTIFQAERRFAYPVRQVVRWRALFVRLESLDFFAI